MPCTREYKYIWCFAADFYFEIMIANAIIQWEWAVRPRKLWEKDNSDKFRCTDNSALRLIRTVCPYSDGDELSVVGCLLPVQCHSCVSHCNRDGTKFVWPHLAQLLH